MKILFVSGSALLSHTTHNAHILDILWTAELVVVEIPGTHQQLSRRQHPVLT